MSKAQETEISRLKAENAALHNEAGKWRSKALMRENMITHLKTVLFYIKKMSEDELK